jgi:predicted glycosyltransferase
MDRWTFRRPAARLRIPNTTTFDYEWAATQHHVICRLATRVLVPEAIPLERLARYGARPPKLVRYAGLKEEYYLADFEPDASVLPALGVDPAAPIAVVRNRSLVRPLPRAARRTRSSHAS